MKNSILLFTFLCLAASSYTECHGGGLNHPLWKRLLKTKESRNQHNLLTESLVSKEDLPVFVGPQEGLKVGDKIGKLPGQPPVKFSQYSGYVTVDPKAGRELFYYFVEAENPENKPLVLWLNDGPACSSMGYGAMMELGPFRVKPDGKTLSYNEYAWNKVANLLFFESPAGVGFSYSKNLSDYVTGDTQTAADSLTFLLNWLERFPEYKTRDFFIAGEDYAGGHFVPQLADLILSNNKNPKYIAINLKGIAIGNGYIDVEDLDAGKFNFVWTHALISDETHSKIIKYCNFSPDANTTRHCHDSIHTARKEIGDIHPYNIYAPKCLNGSSPATPSVGMSSSSFDPCSEDYIYAYLNTNDVQKALHVADVAGKSRPWEACNERIFGNWTDSPTTVIPLIKKLMTSKGIRVWVYSGDTNAVVSVTATKYSLHKLRANVKTAWYPWYNLGEVGGYAVGYDENLTFVTVRGAGHDVPSDQPARALAMFTSFVQGKSPPSRA